MGRYDGVAVRHRCPGSSFARRRESSECQKAAPMLCERPLQCPRNAPGMHQDCAGIAFKLAPNMHQSCARGAFRRLDGPRPDTQPLMGLRHSRACGNPVVVSKWPQFGADGCSGAPGMHRNCIQSCIKHALIVRSWCVPKTPRSPTRHTTKRWSCVIPVHVGIQLLSESGPNSAQTDALEPPECTGIAFKVALNMHSSCARGAF